MKRGIVSKGGFKKITDGHPWLTATEIVNRTILPPRAGAFQLGDTWWLHSPESFLRLRRLGPPIKNWMANSSFNLMTNADQFQAYFGEWMLKHFANTLTRKMQMLDLPNEDLCLRWIFSENDFFPGLVVDIFGKTLVAQINAAPIETFWVNVRKTLINAYTQVVGHAPEVLERRNANVRRKEGLEVITPDDDAKEQVLRWNGLNWKMHPGSSQKTGAYFDQRENHAHTAKLAVARKLKSAWDLCAHEGGFGLHLAKAGLQVIAVDQSAAALQTAAENASLNEILESHFTPVKADVFKWLEEQTANEKTADLIVLDPPSFVKDRTGIAAARKGYVELNTLGLKALKPGAILVSCVCSHHITPKLYEGILREAAQLAGCKIKILEQRGPSADHAPVLSFPEGHYLQAWYIERGKNVE